MNESNSVQHGDAVTAAWQFTEQVPHSRDLGVQVVSVKRSRVCMRLTPQPWMLADDGRDEICTSVLYSLADSASGLSVFAQARELTPVATLDLRMDYLRPAIGDRALLAVATCRHLTDEVAFTRCDILCEGDSQPLATANATFMRSTQGRQFQAGGQEKGGA